MDKTLICCCVQRLCAGDFAKFLSISFVRQIRLPRFAGEANLPPELLVTHLARAEPQRVRRVDWLV